MNTKFYAGIFISGVFLWSLPVYADQVTATFNTGETLDSSKLGDLVTQINDNDDEITALQALSGGSNKFISINPYSALIGGSASFNNGFGANAGLILPESAQSDFSFGFRLPSDYISGDPINVEFIWSTPGTSCDIELLSNFISVSRPDVPFIQGFNVATGISGVGGNILAATGTASFPQSKLYAFTPPDGVTAYEAKDSIVFGLFRRPTNTADTCTTDLRIHGVAIQY